MLNGMMFACWLVFEVFAEIVLTHSAKKIKLCSRKNRCEKYIRKNHMKSLNKYSLSAVNSLMRLNASTEFTKIQRFHHQHKRRQTYTHTHTPFTHLFNTIFRQDIEKLASFSTECSLALPARESIIVFCAWAVHRKRKKRQQGRKK